MNPTSNPRRPPTKPAGWIYLQHTWDDHHKYVGQSKRPVWNRVNEERRTFPWGPQIKPGREGYTILRRVDSSGDPAIDAVLLDLAEAEAIQQWMPTENANRPDPALFRQRLAVLRGEAPAPAAWGGPHLPPLELRPVAARPTAAARRRPTVSWRAVGFVFLSALCVIVTARVSAAMPNPTAPWVVIPMSAVLGPAAIVGVFRHCTRPQRKRRSRRRRHW